MGKIVSLIFITLIISVLLVGLILGERIEEQHGISGTSPQPSQTAATGARILMLNFGGANITLDRVSFGQGATGTTAYLQKLDGTVLATANIVSLNATFQNYTLNTSTSYKIVMDANGSSFSQGTRYQSIGRDFSINPVQGITINWTGGYDNGGGYDPNDDVSYGVLAIYLYNQTLDYTPIINANLPVNNSMITQSSITFDYSINDDYNITNMSLWIDGIKNFSQNIGATSFAENRTISGFSNGTHTWFIQAADNASQITSIPERIFIISNSTFVFENLNITYDLNVGQNIFSINGFFTFLGSSISRITKGWFTSIDSINITTQNIQVNGQNVCLADGTNCLKETKSGSTNITEGTCTPITFNTAFSSTPIAVGNAQNASENNVVSISVLSTSGFDLCLEKVGGGASSTYTVYWIATNAGNF